MTPDPDYSTMITSPAVLQEGFVPKDSIHRNNEVNALSRSLDPITRGRAGGPALLTGPSGVGKTTFAQFAVNQLQETTPEVRAVHVNCWEAHTRFKTLYQILDDLGQATDLHRHSTARDELLDRLADLNGPMVVTLDEVDQLDDSGVVYDLYTLPEVSMILITNDQTELLEGMDSRVRSRLQTADEIHFDSYSTSQLVDILEARVEHGLVKDAISESQLTVIGDAAAGDARLSLSILRTAAQNAEYDGRETITDSDIEDAIPRGREAVRAKALDNLRPNQQVLFRTLRRMGEVAPGELYQEFAEEVDDPPTRRTVRSWMQKLTHYNLVEARGEGPSRTYEPNWEPNHVASP